MGNFIARSAYLNQLIQWKDHQVVKVITGIRRAGKSTLLCTIFADYLIKQGIPKERIIIVNLESIDNEHLCHYKSLYEHIVNRLDPNHKNYVIIDEVQNAFEFQKAVDSLYILNNVDLYITGSNAYMLSGELATLLSGRYVTIEILPLSFDEYLESTKDHMNINAVFRNYLRYGGFPYITQLSNDEKQINQYLEGIYNTILKKDIIAKNKVSDIFVLEDVIRFVFDNIGNIVSSKKISDTLTSNGRKVSRPTVDAYLGYLLAGYAIYKVNRYDIKGKEYLKSLEKYYVTDLGLRNFLLGFRNMDRGHILENVVFLELKRRGYDVNIGKFDDKEIDFIARKSTDIFYIQVTESIHSPETLQRELEPLRAIKDFHRRIIISMDYDVNQSYDGILVINAIDWLMSKTDFS